MAEQFANAALTVLTAAIDSDDTSITVFTAVGFPSTAPFRIRIDDEIMTVTAVAGTTWTVVRASEALNGIQLATAHAIDAEVRQMWTAGAAELMVQEGESIHVVNPDAGDVAFSARQDGDTHDRYIIQADGAMGWGDGSADVSLALGKNGNGLLVAGGAGAIDLTVRSASLEDARLLLESGVGGAVQIYAEPSGGGILFGAAGGYDTDLFRASGNRLATSGAFEAFELYLGGSTHLWVPSPDLLKVDDSLQAAALISDSAQMTLGGNVIRTYGFTLAAGATHIIPDASIPRGGGCIVLPRGNDGIGMCAWYRSGTFNIVGGFFTAISSNTVTYSGTTFSPGGGTWTFYIENNTAGARLICKSNAGFARDFFLFILG